MCVSVSVRFIVTCKTNVTSIQAMQMKADAVCTYIHVCVRIFASFHQQNHCDLDIGDEDGSGRYINIYISNLCA